MRQHFNVSPRDSVTDFDHFVWDLKRKHFIKIHIHCPAPGTFAGLFIAHWNDSFLPQLFLIKMFPFILMKGGCFRSIRISAEERNFREVVWEASVVRKVKLK